VTSNKLTAVENRPLLPTFGREKIDLIKRTVAKGATDDELKLFLYTAEKRGLDPLAKQIYFQKRRSKHGEENITIITGIDGYRAIADRTGKYAGNDDPVFDDEENPRKASVTVYKLIGGVRCAFSATARWDQYYPGDSLGFMWRKMPHLMLGKCAEALALRKAFPDDLSGLYTKEEMEQAGPTVETQTAPQPEPPAPEPSIVDGVFEAEPVVYDGRDGHKDLLRAAAKRHGLNPEKDGRALAAIHAACLENQVEVGNLDNAVKDYLSQRAKQ
jgi:phage recombination protein Bet